MGFFDDVGKAISDGAKAAGQAASDVGHAFDDAEHSVAHLVDKAVSDVVNSLPPDLKHYAQGVGQALKWVGDAANTITKDVGEAAKLASKVPWGDVLHSVEAAVSVVPVLGTALSDVLATAEMVYYALTSKNPLEFAIRTAYSYALASVPGASVLHMVLDTTVDAVIRIAVGHEDPTSALLHSLVDDVPDEPKFGSLSPRSIAASLVKVVASHRNIVDVGLDLVAEASGAAGPVAERAVRAAEQCAKKGFDPVACVNVALDAAPVPAAAREAWDGVRASAKSLGANLLPEDLAALGAFAQDGVQAAVEKALGPVASSGAEAVSKMIGQHRDYRHIVEVMGAVDGVTKATLDGVLSHFPPNAHETSEAIATVATASGLSKRMVDVLVSAERYRHISLALTLGFGRKATPLDVLRSRLEAL